MRRRLRCPCGARKWGLFSASALEENIVADRAFVGLYDQAAVFGVLDLSQIGVSKLLAGFGRSERNVGDGGIE